MTPVELAEVVRLRLAAQLKEDLGALAGSVPEGRSWREDRTRIGSTNSAESRLPRTRQVRLLWVKCESG
jgi:hypothetical protein